MHMMVDNKTRLDIGYGYMHIWVVSGFISEYKDIIGTTLAIALQVTRIGPSIRFQTRMRIIIRSRFL
jgi:hypothetical protein